MRRTVVDELDAAQEIQLQPVACGDKVEAELLSAVGEHGGGVWEDRVVKERDYVQALHLIVALVDIVPALGAVRVGQVVLWLLRHGEFCWWWH